jgi:hypothetical protein
VAVPDQKVSEVSASTQPSTPRLPHLEIEPLSVAAIYVFDSFVAWRSLFPLGGKTLNLR